MKSIMKLFWSTSLILASGCTSGTPPHTIAQVCVRGDGELRALFADLRNLAAQRNMEFSDGSLDFVEDIHVIYGGNRNSSAGASTVLFSMSGSDGLGLTAGNIGLPPLQLAFGFSHGDDRERSLSFTRQVINLLRGRGQVRVLPPGESAKPISECQ